MGTTANLLRTSCPVPTLYIFIRETTKILALPNQYTYNCVSVTKLDFAFLNIDNIRNWSTKHIKSRNLKLSKLPEDYVTMQTL